MFAQPERLGHVIKYNVQGPLRRRIGLVDTVTRWMPHTHVADPAVPQVAIPLVVLPQLGALHADIAHAVETHLLPDAPKGLATPVEPLRFHRFKSLYDDEIGVTRCVPDDWTSWDQPPFLSCVTCDATLPTIGDFILQACHVVFTRDRCQVVFKLTTI